MIRKPKLPVIIPSKMLFFIALFAILAAGASVAPAATSQALRKDVLERLAHLQNVVVNYDMDLDYPPNHRIMKFSQKFLARLKKEHPGIHPVPIVGHYLYACRFSFLHGLMRYDKILLFFSRISAPLIKSILTITPERAESLQYQLHFMKAPIGTIAARASLPNFLPIVWALGLRSPPFPPHDAVPHWLGNKALHKMKFVKTGPDTFSLIQRRPSGYRCRWFFKSKPALELVGQTVSWSGYGIKRFVVQKGQCSDFHKIGGLLLPGRIVETGFVGKLGVGNTEILTKIKYTIGAASNTPKSYLILWPTGSSVIDERINHVFHIGVHRTYLTDKEIFSILRRQDRSGKIKH